MEGRMDSQLKQMKLLIGEEEEEEIRDGGGGEMRREDSERVDIESSHALLAARRREPALTFHYSS